MDVLTPRGQQTVIDEKAAAGLWEARCEGCRYVPTPKESACHIDALLLKDGALRGVAETKCRYGLTEEQFTRQFKGEWLVTMDKLVKGAEVAASLCVPLYGFLYLVEPGVLLTKKLADEAGLFVTPFRCERTETQATVNGGVVTRANAYIDMAGATEYRMVDSLT